MEYNYNWFANDLEEPYTTPDDKPFSWQGRLRVVGGRTNVWGRQSYRFSEQDLQGQVVRRLRRGLAALATRTSRPITSIVEDYVGISGQAENVPELPDGQFHPAMPMTCAETQLRTRVKEKLGRTVTIGRTANITQADQRPRRRATTAGRASAGASRTRTSTPRSRPSPTRCRPATARSSPTRWSTRC